MMKVDEQTKKAILSCRTTASYQKIKQLLDDELGFCVKGLMTASPETVQRLQGKATFLKEFIQLLESN